MQHSRADKRVGLLEVDRTVARSMVARGLERRVPRADLGCYACSRPDPPGDDPKRPGKRRVAESRSIGFVECGRYPLTGTAVNSTRERHFDLVDLALHLHIDRARDRDSVRLGPGADDKVDSTALKIVVDLRELLPTEVVQPPRH